ncbi:hypothetical protein O7630_22945 [Micromonospora sp. WMMD718]|nr:MULTISPECIES: hypothetical protein [unclassified Micromonospora]MDG4753799.1 hypothetical protein [Micromonospora sp. WMMD718]
MRAAAGLDWLRLRNLRHACATFLLVSGASSRTVMKVLGHSQIGLTTWAVVVDSTESAKSPNCDDGGAPGRIRTCGLGIRSGVHVLGPGFTSCTSCANSSLAVPGFSVGLHFAPRIAPRQLQRRVRVTSWCGDRL